MLNVVYTLVENTTFWTEIRLPSEVPLKLSFYQKLKWLSDCFAIKYLFPKSKLGHLSNTATAREASVLRVEILFLFLGTIWCLMHSVCKTCLNFDMWKTALKMAVLWIMKQNEMQIHCECQENLSLPKLLISEAHDPQNRRWRLLEFELSWGILKNIFANFKE